MKKAASSDAAFFCHATSRNKGIIHHHVRTIHPSNIPGTPGGDFWSHRDTDIPGQVQHRSQPEGSCYSAEWRRPEPAGLLALGADTVLGGRHGHWLQADKCQG